MKRRGFALIELLVVIAIIAILAAILFPVFAKAREKARQATCTSNQKQLMLALRTYVQDYDEQFPAQPGDSNYGLIAAAGGNPANYYDQLRPYVKSQQVWLCPDKTGNGAMSYHMSGDIVTNEGVSDAAVQCPAACPAIRDSGNASSYNIAYRRPYMLRDPTYVFSPGCDDFYNSYALNGPHADGGTMIGFADGHAKCYQKHQILGYATFLVADTSPDCLNPP